MPENKIIPEIENVISPLEIPYAYRKFVKYKNKDVPSPPFIVYLVVREVSGGGDSMNLYKQLRIRIELYTDKPDVKLESQLEENLSKIKWEKDRYEIEAEGLYVTAYEFDIIMKYRRKTK